MPLDAETGRKPLRVRTARQAAHGTFVDGWTILRPGDAGYDEALAVALRQYERDGRPIPYAAAPE